MIERLSKVLVGVDANNVAVFAGGGAVSQYLPITHALIGVDANGVASIAGGGPTVAYIPFLKALVQTDDNDVLSALDAASTGIGSSVTQNLGGWDGNPNEGWDCGYEDCEDVAAADSVIPAATAFDSDSGTTTLLFTGTDLATTLNNAGATAMIIQGGFSQGDVTDGPGNYNVGAPVLMVTTDADQSNTLVVLGGDVSSADGQYATFTFVQGVWVPNIYHSTTPPPLVEFAIADAFPFYGVAPIAVSTDGHTATFAVDVRQVIKVGGTIYYMSNTWYHVGLSGGSLTVASISADGKTVTATGSTYWLNKFSVGVGVATHNPDGTPISDGMGQSGDDPLAVIPAVYGALVTSDGSAGGIAASDLYYCGPAPFVARWRYADGSFGPVVGFGVTGPMGSGGDVLVFGPLFDSAKKAVALQVSYSGFDPSASDPWFYTSGGNLVCRFIGGN